jgi:hypothetical protein
VLVKRPVPTREDLGVEDADDDYDCGFLDENGVSRWWADAPPAGTERDRVAELIAAGIGRRRLSQELGMSEYEARQLLERARSQNSDSEPNGDHE